MQLWPSLILNSDSVSWLIQGHIIDLVDVVLIILSITFAMLDTSAIPPLIYALMGTSREIAIGPVAVVSLLISSMVPKLEDPVDNPIAYRKLVFTATFLAGIFQAAFALLRWV